MGLNLLCSVRILFHKAQSGRRLSEFFDIVVVKRNAALTVHSENTVCTFGKSGNLVAGKYDLFPAIDEFPGSVILVSHDQEFVDLVCDFEISLLDVKKES